MKTSIRLNQDDYRNKVLGCWIGKNIGGTIGAPFEWVRQVNNVSFYIQDDLNGQPVPNDDLDIQLLWLCALEEMGLEINAHRLAEFWCLYVTPHWSEYGTAKINMRQGLQPPLCGNFLNEYKHSCGAYIRSEIWACIAPGLPHIAARYAYEDAILDHGDGEGTTAEIFMAALESAAFLVSDLRRLIQIALSYIPAESGVTKAVQTTLECFDRGLTWKETRDEVLRLQRGETFQGLTSHTSREDQLKGFATGVRGYDVPSNIAITLIGLLYGGDDFGEVQCISVNCGEDTDCTAATAGSVWGIIHGAAAIPQKWVEPIGRGIKTVCLNLGELGYFGGQIPATVDELTERTIRIGRRLLLQHRAENLCSPEPTNVLEVRDRVEKEDCAEQKIWAFAATESSPLDNGLMAEDDGRSIWDGAGCPRFDFDFFTVHVEYGSEGPVIRDNEPKALTLTIHNRYKIQANLSTHWYLPDGNWKVSPSANGYAMSFPPALAKPLTLRYTVTGEQLTRATHRAVIELSIEGRPTVMLVPIVLLNGNLMPSVAGPQAPLNE